MRASSIDQEHDAQLAAAKFNLSVALEAEAAQKMQDAHAGLTAALGSDHRHSAAAARSLARMAEACLSGEGCVMRVHLKTG